ncbi:MAG: murein hydrolase activator EnvC family protein, partial [Thermodesulfobacteriota bacterium]
MGRGERLMDYRVKRDTFAEGMVITKRLFYTVIPLLFIFMFSAAYAGEENLRYKILGKEKRYEDIKKRLRDERESVKAISGKESTILGELDKIDRTLTRHRGALKVVEKSLTKITKDIRESEGVVSSLKEKQHKYAKLLEKRLITMYKMRGSGEVRVIISSLSPTDLERRYTYMNALLESNAELIDKYGKNIALLDGEIKKLKGLKSEKVALKQRKIEKMKETRREKRKRLTLLSKTKREKKYRLKAIKELEGAAEELQQLIADLRGGEELHGEVVGFASMRGKLPMPVEGSVVSSYGKVKHPKFRTVTFNNGIFIKAPLEAEVKSVYRGNVLYTGWIKGYGQVIIIDHGSGYYTLFAHLSTIIKEVGAPVEAG